MTSKRSNTASAKGRDIAPGVPAQKGSVMEEDIGRALREAALVADATGAASVSAHAGDDQPRLYVMTAVNDTWCVWTKNGRRPKRFHASREDAETEAVRLAKVVPGAKFHVLHMVAKFWAHEAGPAIAQGDAA